MTSEQVALVQSSFKSVVPIASKATDLFYGKPTQTTAVASE